MLAAPCFHTGLRVEKLSGRKWRLLEDLVFESKLLGGRFVLPAGSIIDFASTPRWVWLLLPPTGQYDFATALHDGGYKGLLKTLDGRRIRLIREWCDKLMAEACDATGVEGWEKALLYRGVRVGGAKHYKGVPDAI